MFLQEFIWRISFAGDSATCPCGDPRAIQALIPHSDLRLTAQRYTDTAGLALTDAVAKLPDFVLTEKSVHK
jgi:hypothetical protein